MAGAVDQSALKNQLAQAAGQAPEKKEKTVFDLIKTMEGEFSRALPEQVGAQRFVRIATTVVRTNPKLMQCDQMSIIAALMQSAQLGLEPNTPLGQAYLIPSKNKRVINGREQFVDEARFEIGYKGLIELALRTQQYKAIYAHEVYANEKFEYQYGLHKDLVHVPTDEPEGEPIKYYAVYHLKNGGYDFVVWSTDRIKRHSQKYSQSVKKGHKSPWDTDFDGMAKKTVLKEVLKYAPKSTEFARQLSMDETIKRDLPDNADMTEVIDVTDWTATTEEEPEATEHAGG